MELEGKEKKKKEKVKGSKGKKRKQKKFNAIERKEKVWKKCFKKILARGHGLF